METKSKSDEQRETHTLRAFYVWAVDWYHSGAARDNRDGSLPLQRAQAVSVLERTFPQMQAGWNRGVCCYNLHP